MEFPKDKEAIRNITKKMLSGDFDTFVCDMDSCTVYKENGPCIYVVPCLNMKNVYKPTEYKPPDCMYASCNTGIIGINTTPLTRPDYQYENKN